ncbi:MAG: Ig-like domain-containing protein [Candidatus Dojkabacteria bacterium]
MRKFLKGLPFKKVFVLLFVSLYTFLPSLQAFGVVIEDYASEDVSVGVDEGGDILDEGISDPAEIANPNVLEEEVVEEPLFVYENGVYTVHKVMVGEEYVYPDNKDVRVRFTSVTEEGDLVISKVELTEEEKELLNTSDDYGWDISSTMSNGSFMYDLTLPNSTESNDVEVKYSEDGNTYESIDNEIVNENVIEIKGLEHFTLFVVVDSPDQTKCNAVQLGTTPYETCFPTIQQAVNAASDGATIYVAAGTYTGSYLSIENKAVSIIGSGEGSTIIKPDTGGAVITINNNTTSGMTIEGFTIDATNTGSGIFIQNSNSNVTIENNKVINFTDKGVLISNSNNNVVQDNTIEGSSIGSNAGVYLDNNSEDNLIDGNTISLPTSGSGTLYNVWLAGAVSGNNTVNNNTLDGGKRSFQQDSSVTGTTIFSNNTINTPSYAGAHLNGGSAEISENTFNNSVRPIEFWAQDVKIQSNIFNGSTYDVINAHSYNSVTANYNTFSNIGFKAVNNQVSAKTIDARYNKWGTSKESVIQSMINGNVTYDPWYGKTVTQEVTVNEYEKGGIYYVKLNDILNFNITGEPVYGQHYITGLWGYNSSTGSRTDDRYIGWVNINPDTSDLVNVDKDWNMVTDHWMGSNAPGTTIPAGDYLLWVERYYDEGVYVSGSTVTKRVTIDNTKPALSVLTPTADERINGPVDISITASDSQTDISSVSMHIYKVEGASKTLVAGCTSIPTTFDGTNWNATINNGESCNLVEGTYEIAAWAYDGVQNLGWATRVQFVIDETAPAAPTGLHILDYEDNDLGCGGYTNNRNITIDWNNNPESDFDHYILDLKDKDNHKQLGVSEYDATIRDADDLYKYKIRAVDKAGNISVASAWCEVTLDRVVPTGTIDSVKMIKGTNTYHITEWSVNDNTPTIEGTVNDNNGITSVKVTINGFTALANNMGGKWEADISSVIPDGTYTISAEFEDIAGNTTIVNQDLTIDTVAPTAEYEHYLNGTLITDDIAYVKGVSELSFKGTITDATPSSGILKDSFVIFEAQDDGSFRFSANGKRAFCSWRSTPNLITFAGLNDTEIIGTEVQFFDCTGFLDDGNYYMAHQIYDSAVRQDIPSIHQYRDVLGLHFIVDSVAPTSNIEIQADLNETTNLKHNNGWHGEGWYYNFDNIVLSVDNPEFGDFIQYQILDGEVSTPGGTWTEATDGIDLAAIINAKADGIYTIFWYAEDLAGNTEEVNSEIVKIDRTNPTYTINFNSINGIANDNVTYIPEDEIRVDVKVGDTLSGYTRARYDLHTADENWNCTFDSSNQDNLVPAENNTTRTLTVSGLSDGRYCLRIWVYDDVQNKSWVDTTGEQWVHFVIDTEFPSTPIGLQRRALDGTIYSCGDYAQLQTLIPDWDDNSDINFDYYEYTSFNANGNIGLDEEILPNSEFVHSWVPTIEETYGYAVRAVDKAGNKSDWALTGKTLADSCQITYDSTPPVIEPLTQYTYNLSEGDAIPDVQTEVTDETGLKKAYYELTNIDLGTFNDDMDLSGTSEIVDTTGLIETYAKDYFGEDITTIDTYYIPEGVYTIEYYVEDIAGNTSPTETVTINITNVAPIVDSFTADVLNITEGDTVSFEAIFSDPSYIEYISGEKHADDADWTYAFNPEGTYEPELTTNVPGETLSFSHTYNNEGAYLAEFRVCEDSLNDGEGECTTKTVEIVVSNNNPTVTITPATLEVTQGTQAVVLSVNVTNGNAPFTYQWTGDCTGSEDQAIFNPTTAGDYTCTVTVTDADGDTATDSVDITVGAVLGATTENGSTKETFDRTIPVLAYGTGGYLLSQIDEQDTDEEEITEEETTTQDSPEVKGEEDNEEQDGEEEETKWWIYPLVILPVLAIFLILWKRRKEDNEPQF